MQNIKITVAMLESAIDDDDSLCVYRDGAPAADLRSLNVLMSRKDAMSKSAWLTSALTSFSA